MNPDYLRVVRERVGHELAKLDRNVAKIIKRQAPADLDDLATLAKNALIEAGQAEVVRAVVVAYVMGMNRYRLLREEEKTDVSDRTR